MDYKAISLASSINWVGVFDPYIRIFDVLFHTSGTTYNSYVIQGKEQIALIDTVKAAFREEFFQRLRSAINPADINYVIVNHTELDHSGALLDVLALAPKARVVVSKNGRTFLKDTTNRDLNPIVAEDGFHIDLGRRTLEFIMAPWLHWPDTMFTYLVEDGILFPCDAFGSHYCPPDEEHLFNDRCADFSYEFRQYYFSLMRPFKEYALQAVEKLRDRTINIIAPSHGPILRHNPWQYIEAYRTWSTPVEQTKQAIIFYASAYGNTRRMAHEIALGLEEGGIRVKLYDAISVKPEAMADQLESANAIILGSPTINGDAVKPVWDILSNLATLRVKGKIGASFGSYGWSGEAVKMLDERLHSLKFKVPLEGLRSRLVPTGEDLSEARKFGQKLAEFIIGG
jgi:flavorubredoxin